jgi:hypothetical protein
MHFDCPDESNPIASGGPGNYSRLEPVPKDKNKSLTSYREISKMKEKFIIDTTFELYI